MATRPDKLAVRYEATFLNEWLTPARSPSIMVAMDTPSTDLITIAAYENLGRLHPMAAARA
ncbi:hypothetical protein OG252_03205 [Streptomyces sp. NBC_01352]|uniref:hypothetical protein n=1 Tax=Streptomyces sp. NBC_01352 TaxID=2903834 RepID=UPI002E37702A|nr:hypothetical protein [Streptomyces sp. NBC_01352]